MKKAVVTGCAGFIGGHLSEKLLSMGWHVLGMDNMRTGLQKTMDLLSCDPKFRPVYADISLREAFPDISSKVCEFNPDLVFHLAAIPGVPNSVVDPAFTNEVNLSGTLNMLEICRSIDIERFIFSSSSSVYGGSATLPTPESTSLEPKSPYALQKKFSEEYCKMYSNLYDIDTVCLRYFNVFGPRQRSDSAYAAAVASFFNARRKGSQPIIYGDGEQTRDFCYISNVVNANILAAKFSGRLNGLSINIGAGETTSINDLASKICALPPIYKPARPGDVRHSMADITIAKETLGYTSVTKCLEGLDKMFSLCED
tara:strand:+ start:3950 stop:4888 length:939 start_codon:yes stop_codon:yes gene_type:complete